MRAYCVYTFVEYKQHFCGSMCGSQLISKMIFINFWPMQIACFFLIIYFIFRCFFTDFVQCQAVPRLEILPTQMIQRKPVGKSLMLTCRADVPNIDLVSDLQWKDNFNLTVPPKT